MKYILEKNNPVEIWQDLILILIGALVGFINTIAGGGSSILYPTLVFMGMPIHMAIGTSRVGFVGQGIFSLAGFKSKGIFLFPFNLYVALSATVGGILGSWLSLQVSAKNLTKFLAFVMLMIAVLIWVQSRLKKQYKQYRIQNKWLYISIPVYFLIGLYGGFIQAGMGFLIILSGLLVNHFSLAQANSVKALIVLFITLPTLYMFYEKGFVNWEAGFAIAIGTSVGAWITSRWSVKVDEKIVRIIISGVIVVLSFKLLLYS